MSMTTLRRELSAGESMSFDGGRVVVTMEEKSGRKARLKVEIDSAVRLDRPNLSSNGIFSDKVLARRNNVG